MILLLIRDRFPPDTRVTERLWATLIEGLRHTWEDLPLRTFVLFIAIFSLVFRGPFMVGIPAYADAHLPEGAAAFGIIMSALGVGSIAGAIVAGTTKSLPAERLGALLLADFFCFGSILIFMTLSQQTWLIATMVMVAAVLDGYVIIQITTWTQQRVPKEKLGRVMSVIMLAGQGLFPVSAAAAGAIAAWDLIVMMTAAGGCMFIITLLGLSSRSIRRMGYP